MPTYYKHAIWNVVAAAAAAAAAAYSFSLLPATQSLTTAIQTQQKNIYNIYSESEKTHLQRYTARETDNF